MTRLAYIRVSTVDQNTDRQKEALKQFKIDKWFEDYETGSSMNRKGLGELLNYIREQDELHIVSFDRLGRSLIGVINTVKEIVDKGCSIFFLHEKINIYHSSHPEWDTKQDIMSKLYLHLFSVFSELQLRLQKESQREGIKIAVAKKKYKGSKKKYSEELMMDVVNYSIVNKLGIYAGANKYKKLYNYKYSMATVWGRMKPLYDKMKTNPLIIN